MSCFHKMMKHLTQSHMGHWGELLLWVLLILLELENMITVELVSDVIV